MEKIKLSLWDTFAFISSSIVLHVLVVANEYFIFSTNYLSSFFPVKLESYLLLLMALTYFMLSGMIIEPLANNFFYLTRKIYKGKRAYDTEENNQLEKFIREEVKKRTGYSIKSSPYHFVKDHLTDTGQNSLFLVFLSKFGFYRSCSFIFALLAVRNIVSLTCYPMMVSLAYLALSILFLRRARQFYDFQGVTLYRTFVMSLFNKEQK